MSLEKDIELFAKSVDLELYDISTARDGEDTIYRVNVLSAVVENGRRRGVSLDECVNLTRLVSPLLDVKPPISGDYRLEVSRAGIERKINSIRQFELSVTERVSLTL